jgi:hypothetical protein
LYLAIPKVCKINISKNDLRDCQLKGEKSFWWDSWIAVNVLKFNRN